MGAALEAFPVSPSGSASRHEMGCAQVVAVVRFVFSCVVLGVQCLVRACVTRPGGSAGVMRFSERAGRPQRVSGVAVVCFVFPCGFVSLLALCCGGRLCVLRLCGCVALPRGGA